MNLQRSYYALLAVILFSLLSGCRKDKPPVATYPLGFSPDSVMVLEGLNTPYDAYNSDLYEYGILTGSHPVVFSSNRETSGGTFNLVYGHLGYCLLYTSDAADE